MKILLIASLLLLSLTQNSLAVKNQTRVETDAYVFSIVESVQGVLDDKVLCTSKNTAVCTQLDLDGKFPVALTLDSGKLFIYCSATTLFGFDLVTHKLDLNPLVYPKGIVQDLEILGGTVYALTNTPSLLVTDYETRTQVTEIPLLTSENNICVKDDVILLNNKVLDLVDLANPPSVSEQGSGDLFKDNAPMPTVGCAATLSTSTTSTLASSTLVPAPVGCAATLSTSTTSTVASSTLDPVPVGCAATLSTSTTSTLASSTLVPAPVGCAATNTTSTISTTSSAQGNETPQDEVDVLLADLSEFTLINNTSTCPDVSTSTTTTTSTSTPAVSKPNKDSKKVKKAKKKAKKAVKKAVKKAAKVVAAVVSTTSTAPSVSSPAVTTSTSTSSTAPVEKKAAKAKKAKKAKKKATKKATKVVAAVASAISAAPSASSPVLTTSASTSTAVPVAPKVKEKKDKKKKKAKKVVLKGVSVKETTVKNDAAQPTKKTTYVVVATGKIV